MYFPIWRHRRAPPRVGGQTRHCHFCAIAKHAARGSTPACHTAGLPGPAHWLRGWVPMRSASTTRARSATSLDPQHGVVVMETWRQCIRSYSDLLLTLITTPINHISTTDCSFLEQHMYVKENRAGNSASLKPVPRCFRAHYNEVSLYLVYMHECTQLHWMPVPELAPGECWIVMLIGENPLSQHLFNNVEAMCDLLFAE